MMLHIRYSGWRHVRFTLVYNPPSHEVVAAAVVGSSTVVDVVVAAEEFRPLLSCWSLV